MCNTILYLLGHFRRNPMSKEGQDKASCSDEADAHERRPVATYRCGSGDITSGGGAGR